MRARLDRDDENWYSLDDMKAGVHERSLVESEKQDGNDVLRHLDDLIHRNALQALYRLPRVETAAASAWIASLQGALIPEKAQPIEQGSQVYKHSNEGYQIIFEQDDAAPIIRVLGLRAIE